jgi:hypothetical protein
LSNTIYNNPEFDIPIFVMLIIYQPAI